MTNKKSIESPWSSTPVIMGREIDATPFRADLGDAREHTLIIGPTKQGMSCLTKMMVAAEDALKEQSHD